MKLFFLFFIISSGAFASDKECEKKCRSDFTVCKDKVYRWAEDQYIDLEGIHYYSPNCEINDEYEKVNDKKKSMNKACKDQKKECLKSCN